MTDQQYIFDENLINLRKKRAESKFSTFLHGLAISDLKDRLIELDDKFLETLIVGHFAKHWVDNINQNKINHISDEEFLKISPNSQDLIISALHLHSANDPISKLVQIRHGLKKNGIFVGYAFGEKSLYELRKSFEYSEIKNFGGVSPRIHPMIDTPTYGALLRRSGFNFCVSDKLHYEVQYENPLDLITDLKSIGETNCLLKRNKRVLTKFFLDDVLNYYQTNFLSNKEDNRYIATFDIICLTGWNSKPKSLI
tara:strand:+ start:311 stop:1072 length:762 start_codon:yes stop_codon:yes gene_type:complete